MICNLPESSKEDAMERKREDEKRVDDVFKELKMEQIKPINVIRVGNSGRFPKKLLVIVRTTDESEKILRSAEEITL